TNKFFYKKIKRNIGNSWLEVNKSDNLINQDKNQAARDDDKNTRIIFIYKLNACILINSKKRCRRVSP
ncbi:MAG TPA: hypothetical protein VF623_09810, partial [Segetibacter sp.]